MDILMTESDLANVYYLKNSKLNNLETDFFQRKVQATNEQNFLHTPL